MAERSFAEEIDRCRHDATVVQVHRLRDLRRPSDAARDETENGLLNDPKQRRWGQHMREVVRTLKAVAGGWGAAGHAEPTRRPRVAGVKVGATRRAREGVRLMAAPRQIRSSIR
jgi:hypothetical protein